MHDLVAPLPRMSPPQCGRRRRKRPTLLIRLVTNSWFPPLPSNARRLPHPSLARPQEARISSHKIVSVVLLMGMSRASPSVAEKHQLHSTPLLLPVRPPLEESAPALTGALRDGHRSWRPSLGDHSSKIFIFEFMPSKHARSFGHCQVTVPPQPEHLLSSCTTCSLLCLEYFLL
jgi:hypothetical protein